MDNINIIQLPEQIFREIFKYLDNETIITSLRNVCLKIREYVGRYIDIRGIFMLTGSRDDSARIIYIFQKGMIVDQEGD